MDAQSDYELVPAKAGDFCIVTVGEAPRIGYWPETRIQTYKVPVHKWWVVYRGESFAVIGEKGDYRLTCVISGSLIGQSHEDYDAITNGIGKMSTEKGWAIYKKMSRSLSYAYSSTREIDRLIDQLYFSNLLQP